MALEVIAAQELRLPPVEFLNAHLIDCLPKHLDNPLVDQLRGIAKLDLLALDVWKIEQAFLWLNLNSTEIVNHVLVEAIEGLGVCKRDQVALLAQTKDHVLRWAAVREAVRNVEA